MLLSDLLSPERICCDVHSSSKKRLLETISKELAHNSDDLSQREIFESLHDLQKKLAEEIKIRGHLIINKEQMCKVAFDKDASCLRNWQKNLLEEGGFKF